MPTRKWSISAWLRDLLAPEVRRPRRSFVPVAGSCEPRNLMSGLAIVTAVATPADSGDASVPATAAAPATDASADDTPPTDPNDPPVVPVDTLLGSVSW